MCSKEWAFNLSPKSKNCRPLSSRIQESSEHKEWKTNINFERIVSELLLSEMLLVLLIMGDALPQFITVQALRKPAFIFTDILKT